MPEDDMIKLKCRACMPHKLGYLTKLHLRLNPYMLFTSKLKHAFYKLELLNGGWVQFGMNLQFVHNASNPASHCAEKLQGHMNGQFL
jgi:hypothetical protein